MLNDVISLFLITFFSFVLIKATDLVIVSVRKVTNRSTSGLFAFSAIILAIGTSLPEFFVGVTSALDGSPTLSLGSLVGSNIANMSLILGLTGLIFGRIRVSGEILKKDVYISFFAGILPTILIIDGTLNRVDGFILVSIYLAYSLSFFKRRYAQIAEEQTGGTTTYRFIRQLSHFENKNRRDIGLLFLGVAMMLFSADMIVRNASLLADSLEIPKFLIGLLVVAVGTSLPEFAFSIKALRAREPEMVFGNLLGSTIANSTLIVGVVVILQPITIHITSFAIAALSFIVIYGVFWLMIRTKHLLQRWEAALLIILYCIFVFLEFL